MNQWSGFCFGCVECLSLKIRTIRMRVSSLLLALTALLVTPLLVSCDSGGGAENQPPNVSFSVSPQEPRAGTSVSFTASASDPNGSIENYDWEFGDGSSASGSSVTHTYDERGSFSAQLTVTDSDGASSSATRTIEVQQQFTQATVTEVRLQDFPFTTNGQGWDPASGPDPYYVAQNTDTETELAASGFYNDVSEGDLPLVYPDTEWTIEDLEDRYAISIYDSDTNQDDFISGIEFNLSSEIGNYPNSVTLNVQETTIEVDIRWER